MTVLNNKALARVLFVFLLLLLLSVVVGGVKAAINNAGSTRVSNMFSGNTDFFDAEAYIKSYSIIANSGSSPYSEYVVYSPTQSNTTLTYDYAYLNVRQPSDDTDYETTDICNNMNTSAPGAGRMRIQLLIDFKGTSNNPDHWLNNQTTDTDNGVDWTYKMCMTGRPITIPAAAFSFDPVSGLWRAYFSTTLRYNYNNSGWLSTYNSSYMHSTGMRLAYHWSVDAGKYISYGDANGDGIAESTIMAGTTAPNDKNARFPIGQACNVTTATNQSPITIYDSDNRANNEKDAWFSIYKKGPGDTSFTRINLAQNPAHGTGPEAARIVDPYSSGWQLWGPSASEPNVKYRPGNGSGGNVVAYINMQPNTKYYLHIFNINSSSANFYRIGLPTDGIYGASNFDCPSWQISGRTTVSTSTAKPGDQVTFRHYVKNNGPDTTGQDIWSDTQVTGGLGVAKSGHNNSTFTNGQERETDTDTITIPSNALNGQQYCQRVRYAPSAHNDTSLTGGPWACVTVSYTYALTPVVAPSDQSVAIGSSVSFGTSVRMDSTYYSNSTDWTIRKIVIPPTASNNFFGPGAISMSDRILGQLYVEPFTCYFYTFRGATCADVATNSQQFNGTTTTPVGSGTYTETMNYPIGTRVCYAVMVNSYNRDAGQYRETASCATVAKYPALTVEQGMVRTGGVFANTSGVCQLDATNPSGAKSNILMHDYNSTARGSYGLAGLAVGRINYFGSHNEYYGKETGDALSRSLLFANNQNNDNKGYFLGATPASTFCLPNTTSLYATRGSSTPSTTPPATPVTPTASVNYTLSNNTLTLAGGTINPGNQVVIRVTGTGTIRITGDILYGPTPTDLAAGQRVPQFILLADGNINIQIADTVTELNGIYSTKGNIYTCATGSTVYNGITSMTSDTCNQALTIKGALIANQVLPYRTAGYNDVNNTTPAETFRLTPEALIGDYQYSQDNPLLRTVRQRELPVRL